MTNLDTYSHVWPPATIMLRPRVELLYTIIIYFVAFNLHTQHTAPMYARTFAKEKKYISTALILHIFAGVAEVAFFHREQWVMGIARPDIITFLLCIMQSITNLILAKFLRRGYPVITRPSYQAGAILRPILSGLALIRRDPDMHRSSVKIINAFIYTRLIIWLLQYKTPRCIRPRWPGQYAIAVPLAAMISMINLANGGIDSFGLFRVMFYQSLVVSLVVVSSYVTYQLENP